MNEDMHNPCCGTTQREGEIRQVVKMLERVVARFSELTNMLEGRFSAVLVPPTEEKEATGVSESQCTLARELRVLIGELNGQCERLVDMRERCEL